MRKLTTTVRLDTDLQRSLKKQLATDGLHMTGVVQGFLKRYVDFPEATRSWLENPARPVRALSTAQPDQLAKVLAASISRLLIENRGSWITEAILEAQLYREGESVFGDRISHFVAEKNFLARTVAPWLMGRILAKLKEAPKVYLVVDSGTTLYWLLREIAQLLIKVGREDESLRRLQIVTNNIPGADAYMTFSRRHADFVPAGSSTESFLSDVVECKLLTGTLLAKYSAVTGEDTDKALQEKKDSAPEDSYFFGLVGGNWIQVNSDSHRPPVPLAAGRGQKSFKERIVSVCDELHVLSPLGRVFLDATIDDINENLGNDNSSAEKLRYEPVSIAGKEDRIKLITTVRSGGPPVPLLYSHSTRISGTYGRSSELNERTALEPVGSLSAILLPFDLAEAGIADQIPIEFPHRRTQTRDFRRRFFSAVE